MKNQSFIHVPNNIFNRNLSPSELMTYCSILSIQSEHRKACASFKALSELCGLSVATVQRNISALCNKQLLSLEKRFYYDGKNRANGYTVTLVTGRGFFRIPRSVIKSYLTPSAFMVLCFMCKCANKGGHAFPSLKKSLMLHI